MNTRGKTLSRSTGLLIVLCLLSILVVQTVFAEDFVIYVPGWGGDDVWTLMAKKAAFYVEKHGYTPVIVSNGLYDQNNNKVLMAVAGGVPVDLVMMANTASTPYLVQDLFLDLGPMAEESGLDLSLFMGAGIRDFTIGGRLYGLPTRTSIYALFYNTALFKEVALEYPPEDWYDPNWDWNEFVSTAKKLTLDVDGDGMIDSFGLALWHPTHMPELWDTSFCDPGASESWLDRPELLAVMQKYADIVSLGVVYGTAPSTIKGDVFGVFHQNKAAMFGCMDENASEFTRQLGDAARVAVMPKGTSRSTFYMSEGWAIASTSKKPEVVFQVMVDMLTDEDFVKEEDDTLPGYLPALADAVEVLGRKYPNINWRDVYGQPILDNDLLGRQPWRYNVNGMEAGGIIAGVVDKIRLGVEAPGQALMEAHDILDLVLKDGAVDWGY